MNFDVATMKRSSLRKEKKSFERMNVEQTPREIAKTIYGYSVQNEVFAVYKILYNIRSIVFKSYWSREYPM